MTLDLDSNGWPTVVGCTARLATVVDPSTLSAAVTADIGPTLASIQSEFQGPTPSGTGRTFTPVTETRLFDGTGYPELRVSDIVPGSALSVSFWGTEQQNILLASSYRDLGYEVLSMQSNAYWNNWGNYGLTGGVFPLGRQNISVTTTWGYAAQVPYDVADAVASEVASRILVASQGGVRGVLQSSKVGDVEKKQAPDVTKMTSAITVWHARYLATVANYRDDGLWRAATLRYRMS